MKRKAFARTGLNLGHSRGRGFLVAAVVIAALFTGSDSVLADLPAVTDIAVESGFQDSYLGHFKRGRTSLAVDFDLDGDVDFFLGNPGDESYILENTGLDDDGMVHFQPGQILMTGEVPYGGASADYDNDGDYDLFTTGGGIEGVGSCTLFRNLWIESGKLTFEDVTDQAGVAGRVPNGETEPLIDSYADSNWADFDQDGDVDLFVSVYRYELSNGNGQNLLWRNNGDGTFTDVTAAVGLAQTHRPSLHSAALDFDNDGDVDIYENNLGAPNVLWENQNAETGELAFVDATVAMSLPGEDLSYPINSFVSAMSDFNNDGWQDILSFTRGMDESSPYDGMHAIFINQGGLGFENMAPSTDINAGFPEDLGVMGCQIGDLNADGIPDVHIGNGGLDAGNADQLFISDSTASPVGQIPAYTDASEVVDFPAPEDGVMEYPSYPYRTHGSPMVDVDNDGKLELTVSNGGQSDHEMVVQEPNRLFVFDWGAPVHFLKVRPIGDGLEVSRDAIGTRFAVTVSENGGTPWTVYATLLAGSAFSAQNGFEVYMGLANADTVHSLTVTWPNGATEILTEGLGIDDSMTVTYVSTCEGDSNGDGLVDPLDSGFVLSRLGCTVGAGQDSCDAADVNHDLYVDQLDVGYVLARLGTCN